MSDWTLQDTTQYAAMGTVERTSSRGTTVKSGGVNIKGSYGELIASTPFDTFLVGVHIGPGDTVATALADIAIGPKNSETPILNNLSADMTTAGARMYSYLFPLSIPARSRLSVRIQSNSGSAGFTIAGFLGSGGLSDNSPLGRSVTYGAVTATSRGTQIDPGATANVKGAWVQLVGNTTGPITRIVLAIGNQANDVRTDCDWLVDVGIGPAGSEVVRIPNIPLDCLDNGDIISPRIIGPLSLSIPIDSRIAVRAQCSITDATDRLFDVILYGVG